MMKNPAGDNAYNRVMTRVFDLILISALAFLFSAPVITAGAAWTAACALFMKMSKGQEGAIVKSYYKEFCGNLKESVGGWVINLMLMGILTLELFLTRDDALQYGIMIGPVILCLAYLCWYLCLRARFRENTVSAIVNALKFTMANLPVSLLSGGSMIFCIIILFRCPILISFLPVAGIACFLYLPSCLIGKKIDVYMKEKNLVRENGGEESESGSCMQGNVEMLTSLSARRTDISKIDGFFHYLKMYLANECRKLREMKKKEKIGYLLTYYRGILLMGVLLIAGVLMLTGRSTAASESEILRIAVINSYHSNGQSYQEISEKLFRKMAVYSQETFADGIIRYDSSYQIAYSFGGRYYGSSAANDSDYDKFFLNIRNGWIDVAIVPQSFLEYCDLLGEVYDGIPLDISDGSFVQEAGIDFVGDNAGERCYLILPCGGKNRENAELLKSYFGEDNKKR